ncbi:MAG: histidine phosphatase family protein [Saprospiraceae bacterium]|jgi:probable phosphoglycerate mutase|nr:histidine phosphatase family protein [Saprospiraceae bacterium]
MKKRLFLVRHGQTDFNLKGIIQGGGVDSSINEKGREQAQAFFEKYKNEDFEAVLTSKLKRTHQTVAPFLDLNLHWEQHGEIDEMNWGIHEGKKPEPSDVEEYKTLMQSWANEDYHARLEGGESAFELGQRLSKFIQHIKLRKEKKLLICSHGRAMRGLLCLLDGQTLSKMQNYEHKNTGLYIVDYQLDKFEFKLINDRSHFEFLPKS